MKNPWNAKSMDDFKREIKDAQRDEKEGLTEAAYNRFADGSRARKSSKKIDPETESAIRKAFDIQETT